MYVAETFIIVVAAFGAAEAGFLRDPESKTILYGETGIFVCTIDDQYSYAYEWRVNDTIVQRTYFLENQGLEVSADRITATITNTTLEVNGSFFQFNNLQVQCRNFNLRSAIATLRIEGPAANLNLTVVERSYNFIILNWTKPERIVLRPHDNIDVKYYKIKIFNIGEGRLKNVTINGNMTAFLYRTGDSSDYCSFLQFCVSPIRSAGVEKVEECVMTSLKRGIIMNSPEKMSTEKENTAYICNITCSEDSLVTWIVNGKSLQSLHHLAFSASSNYLTTCYPEDTNNASIMNPIYTEHLEMEATEVPSMQLQCVSIFHCNSGLEDCTPSVCFSRVAHLIEQPSGSHSDIFTTDTATAKLHKLVTDQSNTSYASTWDNSKEIRVLFGTTIGFGLALILMCTIYILLLYFYLKLKKSQKGELHCFAATRPKFDQNEDIYDLCGGPTSKVESLYEKPKTPSPQPNMQPCEAYSTLPAT